MTVSIRRQEVLQILQENAGGLSVSEVAWLWLGGSFRNGYAVWDSSLAVTKSQLDKVRNTAARLSELKDTQDIYQRGKRYYPAVSRPRHRLQPRPEPVVRTASDATREAVMAEALRCLED